MQGIEGQDNAAKVLAGTLAGLRDGLESIRYTMAQSLASDKV